MARGIDEREVKPDRERKSLGAEDTFPEDISTLEEALRLTAPLAQKVWNSCDARGLHGRTVTLKVKYADFEQVTRSRSKPVPLSGEAELLSVVEALLRQSFPSTTPVRLLGVTISNFVAAPDVQAEQIYLPL